MRKARARQGDPDDGDWMLKKVTYDHVAHLVQHLLAGACADAFADVCCCRLMPSVASLLSSGTGRIKQLPSPHGMQPLSSLSLKGTYLALCLSP